MNYFWPEVPTFTCSSKNIVNIETLTILKQLNDIKKQKA